MPSWEQMQQMPGFGTCKACGQKRRGRCLDGNKPVRGRYKNGVAYVLGGCTAGWIPRYKNRKRGVSTTSVGGGWSMSRPHVRGT